MRPCIKSQHCVPPQVTIGHTSCNQSAESANRDHTREFTSATFTNSLAKLGVCFCPSLPYYPQENSKAELLNRTLGDMARAMLTQSGIPICFWQFANASACFIHNRIPTSCCAKSSPYQELYGQPPSIWRRCFGPHTNYAPISQA
ncbi:hypothetical protein O181_022031 [Austropuccinia psidii MF-1]|uniref:Integrase catalytic domain-containing protein n=1 Tax=Austropuccinia psidii MF-1 TaxID=1389203 RepID=A0A9Q3CGM3_9BASI|nr:hypothetical protein [Austropuccinia psidii MF-1]